MYKLSTHVLHIKITEITNKNPSFDCFFNLSVATPSLESYFRFLGLLLDVTITTN